MSPLLVVAAIVLIAFATATMAGFGAAVIALTLGAHVEPIAWWVPRLLPVNVCLMGYILVRHRAHVEWSVIRRQVVPVMGLGMLGGFALSTQLEGDLVKTLFGLFVVVVAARELLGAAGVLKRAPGPMPASTRTFALLGAGLMHGLYLTGGPLLVYALSGAALPKTRFRSTLAAIWITLNSVLLVAYAADHRLTSATLQDSLLILPVVLVAMVIGEWAHHRVDEARFRVAVFGLLLLAGLTHVL